MSERLDSQQSRAETFVPVFAGRINSSGELVVGSPDYHQWLRTMANRTVEVIVQEPYQRRSLDANAYYHFVVKLIMLRTGYTEKETEAIVKAGFLPIGVESTRHLSRKQFSEFLEMVIYFADWLGCKVPPARKVAVAA